MNALAIRLEDRETQVEIEALREADTTLAEEIAKLSAKIHGHFAFIGQEFDAEAKMLQALQAELAELNAPQQAPHPAPEPPPEEREAQPAPNRHDRRMANSEAKRLFRQIAQRCHPDRTADELLHGIFLQAKDAYARGDVAALQELRRVLGSGVVPRTAIERRAMRLQVERDKLAADVAEKERALAALRASQELCQVRTFEAREAVLGRAGALDEIRQALASQIRTLRGNIQFQRAMRRQQAAAQQQQLYNSFVNMQQAQAQTMGGGLWSTLFGGSPW